MGFDCVNILTVKGHCNDLEAIKQSIIKDFHWYSATITQDKYLEKSNPINQIYNDHPTQGDKFYINILTSHLDPFKAPLDSYFLQHLIKNYKSIFIKNSWSIDELDMYGYTIINRNNKVNTIQSFYYRIPRIDELIE